MKYNIIGIIIVFALIQFTLTHKKQVEVQQIFVPPATHINLYSFGYNSLISSLLWVRVLQDINICDQKPKSDQVLANFTDDKDIIDQILNRELPPPKCENSWVFQMLDVITTIDPTFKAAYADGATFLSVLVDDRVGAQKIFNRGISYYPDDWGILYRAAYHELFELQNPETATTLLNRAGLWGAPRWVFALSARLLTSQGRAEFAKTMLESVLNRKSDGYGMDRVRGQLEKINEILKNSPEK